MKNKKKTSNLQEEYRQLVFDALDVHIAVIDQMGNMIDVNEPWLRFAVENGITDPQPTVVAVNYLEVLRRSQANGDKTAGEIMHGILGVLDGSRSSYTREYPCDSPVVARWFTMKVVPLPGPQGGAVIAHENITGRKHHEIALHDSEEKFHQMFDKHNAIMLLIEPNSGTIVDANLAAQKFYGYSLEQFKWMKIQQINTLPPEEVEQRRKQAAHESLNSFVFSHRLANGEVRMVEVHSSPITVNGSPLLFSIIHDITARQQAEAQREVVLEKLRESEKANQVVLNTVAETLFLMEVDGKIITANTATARRFDKQVSELIGANIYDFIPPEVAQTRKAWAAKVVKERQAVHFEDFRFNRWMDNYVYPVMGEDGQVRRLAVYAQDITERKQVEETLRQSEERFRTMYDISPDAIGLFDANANIVMMNPSAAKIFGYASSAEMLGKNALEFFMPADREQAARVINQIFTEGRVRNVEFELLRKDGSRFVSEFSCSALYGADGDPEGFLAITRDITERKQAEQALRESEQKFTTAFHISPVGMLISRRRDGVFLEVNEEMARISGYARAELLGQSVVKMGLFTSQELLEKFAVIGVLRDVELQVKHKSGQWRWISLSTQAIKVQGEDCFLVIVRDIHEQKQFEDEKRQSEDKFRALLYNSPLQSVIWKLIRDAQGTIMDWEVVDINPQGAASIGLEINAALGRRALDLFGAEVMAAYLDLARQIDATGQPVQFETYFPSNNRYYWSSNFLLGNDLYANVSMDITALKTAQSEIETAARFPSENPNPVLRLNQAGVIVFANAASGALLRDWGCAVGERAPVFWQAQIADALSQQKSRMTDFTCGEIIYSANIVPISEVGYVNLYLTDITQRKQAENVLRESEEKFSKLFHASPVLISIAEKNTGKFFEVNETWLKVLEFSREEVIGHVPSELKIFADHAQYVAAVNALRAQGYLHDYEIAIRAKSGRVLNVLFSEEWIQLQGKPYLLTVASDITRIKQVEADLRDSRENLEMTLDGAEMGLWTLNLKTLDGTLDERAYQILGYAPNVTPDHLDGWNKLSHPEDVPQIMERLNAYLSGAVSIFESEHRVLHASGEYRWASIRGKSTKFAPDGSPLQLAGTVLDVTPRKTLDEKLRQSQALLEEAQRIGKMGYIEWNAGDDAIAWSDETYRIYEVPQDGTPVSKQRFMAMIAPEHQKRLKELDHKFFAERSDIDYEYPILLSDNTLRWIHQHIKATYDQNGKPERMLGVIQDITERKHAEEALRASEEKYRSLVESLDSAILLMDSEGKFQYLNEVAATSLGRTSAEILGKTMADLFPETDASAQLQNIKRVFREKREIRFEEQVPTKNGVRWLHTSILPVHDGQGDVSLVLINAVDIDELKLAQQQLLELNQTLEERVRERAAQIQDLYDNAPVGYHSIDKDGKIIAINQTELNWLGYTREEMLGKHATEFFTEQGKRIFAEVFLRFMETGSLANLEFEAVRKDGTIFPVNVSATAIYDAAGNFLSSRTTLVDITERKRVEMALRESEQKYSVLFNKSAVPVILAKHPEGIYVDVNEAFLKAYGYSREEMLGKTSLDVGLVRPDNRSQLLESFTEQGKYEEDELHAFTKAGEERINIIRANAVELGGQRYSITTAYDITEQKRAEMALRKSEERLALAFRAAQDGIWDWNLETDEVFYSSRWKFMLGYADDEIEPHVSAWKRLLHPADLPPAMQMVEEVLQGKREYMLEFRMHHKDGHYVPVLSRGIPIRREPNGPVVRIVGTHFDLTERKNAEAQLQAVNAELERAMRVKDEFLASMSHELRTPLTGVLGISEAMQLNVYGSLNEKQTKAVQNIESSGRHLLELINDILDLAKIEADKLELDLSYCSIGDICQASLQLIKGMSGKKRQQVIYAPLSEPVSLYADARRLKQVLVNLLSNAIKFTPENGELGLEVSANAAEHYLKLTVWDKGIGIKPEYLNRLFKPFQQIDSRLAREYEGTGLGLSLVSRLVELHGGTVAVESVFGAGSRFTITLPWQPAVFDDAQNKTLPTQAVQSGMPAFMLPAKKPLLVVVDDNDLTLQLITDFFQARHFDVVTMRSGNSLLGKISELHPDVLLMDIQMPDMDGLEAIRRVRTHTDPQAASVPIIALTALAMVDDREQCLQAGANEYISKPVKLTELAEVVVQQLKNRAA